MFNCIQCGGSLGNSKYQCINGACRKYMRQVNKSLEEKLKEQAALDAAMPLESLERGKDE